MCKKKRYEDKTYENRYKNGDTMNKKGQTSSFFEGFMIIVLSVIFFAIVSFALLWTDHADTKASLRNVEELHRLDSALNNLLLLSYTQSLEGQDIDSLVKQSKILNGITVTSCRDYTQEGDCHADVVGLHKGSSGAYCRWSDGQCMVGAAGG